MDLRIQSVPYSLCHQLKSVWYIRLEIYCKYVVYKDKKVFTANMKIS